MPIAEKYHFLKKKEVTFDIDGFIPYLQSMEGGNKDLLPEKATAAHIRSFFRFTPETTPPHKALLCFTKLKSKQYPKHLTTSHIPFAESPQLPYHIIQRVISSPYLIPPEH